MKELVRSLMEGTARVDKFYSEGLDDFNARMHRHYVNVFRPFLHTIRMRVMRNLKKVLNGNKYVVTYRVDDNGTLNRIELVRLESDVTFAERLSFDPYADPDIMNVWDHADAVISASFDVSYDLNIDRSYSDQLILTSDNRRRNRTKNIRLQRFFPSNASDAPLFDVQDLTCYLFSQYPANTEEWRIVSLTDDEAKEFLDYASTILISPSSWESITGMLNRLTGQTYSSTTPIINCENFIEYKGE